MPNLFGIPTPKQVTSALLSADKICKVSKNGYPSEDQIFWGGVCDGILWMLGELDYEPIPKLPRRHVRTRPLPEEGK